jgi:hypothetical protein
MLFDIDNIIVSSIFVGIELLLEYYFSYSLYQAYQDGLNGELFKPATQGARIEIEQTIVTSAIAPEEAFKATPIVIFRSSPTREYDTKAGVLKNNEMKIIDFTSVNVNK